MNIVRLCAMSVLGLGLATGLAQAAGERGAARGRAEAGARGPAAGAVEGRAPGLAARGNPAARAAARASRAGEGRALAGRGRAANRPPEERIDQRQANQQRRIDAGTKRGQLTTEEIAKLQDLENHINTLETEFKTDGKLTRDEVQKLRQSLNQASLQIWAERHNTEGNQMPVIRLGKEVFAQDQLIAKIESGDITREQARQFLGDFRKMANLKRQLATEELPPDTRATLQAQYNELLNKYFVLK